MSLVITVILFFVLDLNFSLALLEKIKIKQKIPKSTNLFLTKALLDENGLIYNIDVTSDVYYDILLKFCFLYIISK